MYCLVVIDDYSRFTWVFFLATKDETSGILKSFITGIENLVDHNVKVIRCDNGTEFKNREMNQFCDMKGILRQFSVARTPQQNGVAKRKNRTLIEAARTMLADSKLSTTFWAEAVNTVCYVQNKVKAFRVIQEFLEQGDIGRKLCILRLVYTVNGFAEGTKASDNAASARKEMNPVKDYILLTIMATDPIFSDPKSSHDNESELSSDNEKKVDKYPRKESKCNDQEKEDDVNNTNNVNAAGIYIVGGKTSIELPFDPNIYCFWKMISIFDFLKRSSRAWYETLSTYLLDNELQRRKIDKTLFIKRHKGDILLVQVYVDDIIFGSTKKELCNAFEKLMHEKFQMSSIGELKFFLGLQVQQKKDGIFISQDKYVVEILKKCGFTKVKTASIPMETQNPLLKDKDGEEVDVHMYRSIIGSLMYLTSSRPDIMFAVCACARYQVNPKVSHLHVVKRIFRYLKGQPKLGLWYPKDSPFDLVAYTDSDYAGASLDRKSTTGGCQFLGCRLISWQCKKQTVVANSTTEAEYVAASSCCGQLYSILLGKAKKSVRLMMEKLFRMELKLILTQKPRKPKRKDTQVPQPSGPTDIVADKAVRKELGDSLVRAATTASSLEAKQDSGGGPRCHEIIGDTIAQTRFENVSKLSNDSLLARESSGDEEDLGKDASKQERRINAIDVDEDITLVSVQDDADVEMFDVGTLTGDEVFAEQEVAAKGVNLTVDEVTLAQALAALKRVKPKVKGVVIEEPSIPVNAASASIKAKVQDKGKGKIVEPEPVKSTKNKVQIMLNEEIALKLQAEIDEEERIGRAELAERLQAEEQEQFTIEEKATLFKELLEHRRKHFAAKREKEKRNKPPTKTQQKKTMINYLKNMEGWKHKDLKSDFDSIKELFDKAFKRVDEDKDTAELQSLMEVIPNEEEVTIDDVPLATKSPKIVGWKIHKKGKKSYYQIIRADGKSQMYMIFSQMIKSFDSEDLEDLYKLVKARYGSTRPVEDLDLVLWNDLKTMFEPHVEDEIWKLQQRKEIPLTPPTITYMLNKKLQVDYFSKMAHQLLKLLTKQLKNQ
ncbi:uncharacterized mitochondrial protein-like protein [Tanacetum coccineum]